MCVLWENQGAGIDQVISEIRDFLVWIIKSRSVSVWSDWYVPVRLYKLLNVIDLLQMLMPIRTPAAP